MDRLVHLHQQDELPLVGDEQVARLPEQLVGAAPPVEDIAVEAVDVGPCLLVQRATGEGQFHVIEPHRASPCRAASWCALTKYTAMSVTSGSYRLLGMPYADVNGLHLYFEEYGEGPLLVLLHGGLLTIELSFGVVIPVLAEHHRVIAVELQGHGRTADIDRPMSFDQLAADVVGLLDHLGIERADVIGFSLGGLTTYELLVRHPDRIGRAVVASADHRNDRGGEVDPERLPTEADFAAMREAYAAVAPDPSHFEAFAEKACGHGPRIRRLERRATARHRGPGARVDRRHRLHPRPECGAGR